MMIKKKVKVILGILIVIAILFFLSFQLFKQWDILSDYKWDFDYSFLFVSIVLLTLQQILLAFVWLFIIKKLGGLLKVKRALKIWFYSQLGRYIPGKVWIVIGKVYLCSKEGIPKAKTLISVALELGLLVVSGCLVFILSAFFWKNPLIVKGYSLLMFFIPVILILIYPPILKRIINFGLRLLKKEVIEIQLKYSDILHILSLYALTWCIMGISFYFFVKSISDVPITMMPILTGIFAISWVIGFLSIITPGGIGVREGVLTYLLSFYFPLSIAIIISLASRVWITLVEACLAVTILNLRERSK